MLPLYNNVNKQFERLTIFDVNLRAIQNILCSIVINEPTNLYHFSG